MAMLKFGRLFASSAISRGAALNIISKNIQQLSKKRDHILKLRGALSGAKTPLNPLQRVLLESQPRVVNQQDFLQKLYDQIEQQSADRCGLAILFNQLHDLHKTLSVIDRTEEHLCKGIDFDMVQARALFYKPRVVHQLIVLKKVLEEITCENEILTACTCTCNQSQAEVGTLDTDTKEDKHRYLLISNGCEIHCLDLKQMNDQCLTAQVPFLPVIATFDLLEQNLPTMVGLFKWRSNVYMFGGQKLPPISELARAVARKAPKGIKNLYDAFFDNVRNWIKPTSHLIRGLSLNHSKTSLSPFESDMGKLMKKPKIWPIVVEMDGEIHVIDCCPPCLYHLRCLEWIGSHEVLDLDSGRWVEEVYPPPGVRLDALSDHLVVGNKIYAVTKRAGFLMFDSRKNKWHTARKDDDNYAMGSLPMSRHMHAWHILQQSQFASGIGGFPYGEIRNPLHVVIAIRYQKPAVAYLLNSSGQVICFQPLVLLVKGLDVVWNARIINVEEDKMGKKRTMCSIVMGDTQELYAERAGLHVFIDTFTVEELPDAADKVRQVAAKGSEEWPVELEFARVDVVDRRLYRTDAELPGGDARDWIDIQACFI